MLAIFNTLEVIIDYESAFEIVHNGSFGSMATEYNDSVHLICDHNESFG